MGTIIALRGRQNSGKTQTITILHRLLQQKGYQQVQSNIGTHVDFNAIFKKKGKLIGITSAGDTYDIVLGRLTDLVNAGCEICVCACRTSDRGGPGTNAAVHRFPSYQVLYIEKTTAGNHAQANNADAHTLLVEIEGLI